MSQSIISAKGIEWIHIQRAKDKDLEYLQDNFRFHHLDYDDIQSETPISKMDPYKHYIFFVFHIPTMHKDSGHVHGEELYVFLSQDKLVTLTNTPIDSVQKYFGRLKKGNKSRSSVFAKGTSYLMYKILHDAFRGSMAIVGDLTQEVARLEDAIQHKHQRRITVDLGHVRRNVLYARHLIDPQRSMLASLANLKRPFLTEENHLYLDDLHDVLDTIWLTADNLKLLIDGMFDVNEALLSHKTNDIITLLTIISASLMVPTLLAGFYGMNVPWLPYYDDPRIISFLYFIGFVGMIAIVVAIVKRSKF